MAAGDGGVSAEGVAAATRSFDLATDDLRTLNSRLHGPVADLARSWRIENPDGAHNVAVGLDAPIEVEILGHVGYYCAGMNQQATVEVHGSAGVGVAENMMSGRVVIRGNASQSAAATAHGGTLVVHGNASARCGISLKGADVLVRGSIGHMGAFMAQSGRLVVCGDAGEALGDSLYEADIYVLGEVTSLGADCEEKEMRENDALDLTELLAAADFDDVAAADFRRFGSARRLYNFDVDDAGGY
jgi:glutamate synthase domain-containing protein 3